MEVLRTAILDTLRQNKGGSFTTAQVVQQMYPEDWKHFLGEVNTVARILSKEGLIAISQVKKSLDSDPNTSMVLEISLPKKV